MRGRVARSSPLLCLLLVACGTDPPDTASPAAQHVDGDTHGLSAVVLQYREDEVKNQMQLKVSNAGTAAVTIGTLALAWPGMDPAEPKTPNYPIAPGGRVDLVASIGRARCSDPPQFEEAFPSGPIAAVASIDGVPVTFPVTDAGGVLARIYAVACLRQAIEHRVGIAWDPTFVDASADPPTMTGTLHLTRGATDEPIEVQRISGTVVVNVSAPLPVTLGANDATVDLPVTFTNNRCDAHALGEVKKPFEFLVNLRIDGSDVGYIAAPDAAAKAALFAALLARCPPDAVP